MLDEPPRLLDHHLGNLYVARGRLVERGTHHLALHRPQHVGDFLGPFVHQQNYQDDLRMIMRNRLRDRLQHHGLARERRRDD